MNQLFIEIDKFDQWAKAQFNIPQDEIGGEWECNYDNWTGIYQAFEKFLAITSAESLTQNQKERILYIIARDNDAGYLAGILNEPFLIELTEQAINNGSRDNKWQLAIQLYKLSDRQKALDFLEQLVNDNEEYVTRRALMELAKLKSEKVEFYAEKFWHKDKYGKMEEYQKIAVLHALKTVNSKYLHQYIELALQSGQKYLIENAEQIQRKI